MIIDDFSSGAFSGSITSGSFVNSQLGTMLGGERDVMMEVTSNPLNANYELHINNGGGFALSNSDASVNGRVTLQYDGIGDEVNNVAPLEPGPGLNMNLAAAGDRFRLNFLSNDLPLGLTITLQTISGGTSSAQIFLPGNQNAHSFDLLFATFGGSVNFSDVDSITFEFDNFQGGDFALDSIEAVPEPATMAALGAGFLALAGRRRRRS